MGVFHGSERRSRGVGRGGVVAHGCCHRYRGGAGSPPKSARTIRLLRAVALLVAVVLRSRRRTRHAAAAAVRGAAYSFVVHGLWPQYERGFPEFCQQPSPRLDRNIVSSMLDLMPAPRLIFNEWDRHGTCSGLSPNAYFETIRKARAAVKIPGAYIAPSAPLTVTPDEVE